MTTVQGLARATGYSAPAIRLRRDKFGLPEKFDGRKVVLLAPLDGGTASDQMTLEKARTELALQQARKAKVDADKAESKVIAREDVVAALGQLYDGLATIVRGSELDEDKKEDIFATLDEFASNWARENDV